jgi:hypothetical protein
MFQLNLIDIEEDNRINNLFMFLKQKFEEEYFPLNLDLNLEELLEVEKKFKVSGGIIINLINKINDDGFAL